MKICVFGAGAVGGHLAGRLAAAGTDVSLIARNDHLAAVRERGLRVETRDGVLVSHPTVTDRPGDLGPQDVVLVAVKAPALPAIAEPVSTLLGPDSQVVFVTNGVPWWYFHAHGGPLQDTRLPRLDPDDALWRHVHPDRAVGAVAYTAGSVVAPGVIRAENARNRLVLGRPDGAPDGRLDALADLLRPGGVQVDVTSTVRDAVWAKLVMNLVGGSLGALTGSAMGAVMADPVLADLAGTLAREGAAIARALGCDPGDTDAGLARLGGSSHVQSIAQDLLAGRPMEIDALFRTPLDLARMADVDTPGLDAVVAMATQRARVAGSYRD
ncbi:ketopantoate reductase family protein [Modestobacter sp. Leaf380]|uniref:ketopantoate reductase family protein n=1 Tax=Modestobacter sp. Leaf380 TaxID=1736356 RepID=UPI0006F4262A|nr:2-dehydropantoate 2-reductase [Modestobacter sp. Leaf380]KQS64278.1 hypothetical protein ASG41_16545 [Modestobacter sp. Leaf380]